MGVLKKQTTGLGGGRGPAYKASAGALGYLSLPANVCTRDSVILRVVNLGRRFGDHVFYGVRNSIRASRVLIGVAVLAGLGGSIAAVVPTPPVPGLSFRISSSLRIYPGDVPRGQDDQVMRGRGVAAGGRS